ncbi:hypothetical protein [Haladaptatus halobius]|uniref:hypothetical protein n=1 Tax=Haladaptatus halobius TaxID=2884875 RepID=UPI001D0AAB39|nr:hypothetical protein [Haladaptatus halobius]
MPDTLITRIRDLREAQPTQYGLLSAHHQEAQQALEACQRNYPCVSQLYEILDEPALDRRMLGNILSLLVQFGILGVYSERNNSNRYDLTQYDQAAMQELAHVLKTDIDR